MMAECNKQILTKLSLNNKIVEMRKYVKRARIHSINKLCKEIKRLKNNRAAEERKAKKLKKAENLVRQVLFMKKINADDVTKFALLNDKSTKQVLNDANESLERKVLVRLTCHKLIVEQIKRFLQVFYYTPDSLQFLMETLGEKYKNKKSKKRVAVPSPTVSRISSKRMVTQTREEVTRCNIEVKNNVNSDCIKDLCLVSKKSKTDNFGEDNQQAPKITTGEHDSKITTSFKNTKKIGSKDEIRKKVKLHGDALSRVEDTEESIKSSTVPIKIKPESMIADPFFMTKDNFEYLSVSMKKNVMSSCSNNNEYHKLGDHRPVNKCVNRGGCKRDNNDVYKTAKCKIESKNHSGNLNKSTSKSVKLKTSDLKCISSNDTMLPIHPSWEAKRKYRSSALNCRFEGKKIKFDE